MAKIKSQYNCRECGGISMQWQGQCPHCHSWNSLEESAVSKPSARSAVSISAAPMQWLGEIRLDESPRIATGSEELDRVLGGGLVPGGVVLLAGDPGIGKSTLWLQTLAHLSGQHPVLYVSGEESAAQIGLRAQRLGVSNAKIPLMAETHLERIMQLLLETSYACVVIDSIQTMYSDAFSSAPGSVTQVRECAAQLIRLAKQKKITLILVGHVTKEGMLAGPRVLEHLVDTVLYFEGETHSNFRLIRAVKNRFGAVHELGAFAMTEKGLRSVDNPSALFLSQRAEPMAGSAILVSMEGSRPLCLEIQALVDSSHNPNPRRLSVGLEANRLAMLLAVLHRHVGIATVDQDVFVNAVGGLRVTEPAADLAVLLAIISSLKNRALPEKLIIFGEIGLTGEIRPVQRGQERLREAAKLGFTQALIPHANKPKHSIKGLEIHDVEQVSAAMKVFR